MVVIAIAAMISVYWVRSLEYPIVIHASSDGGRNERSTPREFILPATPAVAFDQEARRSENASGDLSYLRLERCSDRLSDLGYDVGDEIVRFNAKLVEAIYLYQEHNGIRPTGSLDSQTIRAMKC